ncbi:PLAT domain-containing protein 1-like [Euphorbia lathyris]|uniref:PLAT domain-containing protein 1-like n=1 Tax=Euphorbia lathyris TaxID=212925 RepID=UPI003313C1C9
MALKTAHLLSFLLLLAFSTVAFSDSECVYTLFIRTGSIFKGGTDSIVSVRLYDELGEYIGITNLRSWGGLMGPEHSYFERGNLDFFSGKAPCLSSPVCALNLTSDGVGPHHGWYVNYVEVATAGVHGTCSQEQFTIEQWLASDAAPYELTAIRNNCPTYSTLGRKDRLGVKSASI